MRSLLRFLGSLQLTVVLLLALAVVLSAATIVESLRGAEAARSIYYAPWFFALQGLFAINVVFALVERWPRNRWRIGFATTHLAMLLILGGALATALVKVEGRLPLWEGQRGDAILTGSGDDEPGSFDLPFGVRLDAFEIDVYPGTRRPAMFRSRVTVLDPQRGEISAVIEMNRPLTHRGFSFFQSSYQIREGREMSILAVSRDPGEPFVFVGYGLLVAGMIIVFFTRIVQFRAAARTASAALVLAALGMLGSLATASPLAAAQVPDAATVESVRALPVQHDGRTMPFDTQAREAVRTVTGRRAWPGIDPVAMALGWAFDARGWVEEPIVRVDGDLVAAAVGVPAGTRWASFRQLAASPSFGPAVESARARQQADEKLSPLEKDLLELEQRLLTLDEFFRGEAILALPAADPLAAWSPARAASAGDLARLEERVRPNAPSFYPTRQAIARELVYHAGRPARVAWVLLAVAALAAGVALARGGRALRWIAAAAMVAGFAVMTWGLATRWQIAGRIPASNMYESMLFLAWGVGLFGVVSLALSNRILLFNSAAMSALAMALVDLLPMDPFVHPMPPVLSGTPWLAIHVPIIMVSYSVFAISTFLAHVVIGVEIFAPARRELAQRWSELLYWYLHVGAILLIAGILTGSIWAASSWGRYWGWDPKEVWSLVAFLAYMAILHARFDGQIEAFGVAAASIGAFWTILMTYLGVNFVLASGLHSYGFGSSNLVRILTLVAAVEIAYLVLGWLSHRRRRALTPPAGSAA